jgi:hypothetical protein
MTLSSGLHLGLRSTLRAAVVAMLLSAGCVPPPTPPVANSKMPPNVLEDFEHVTKLAWAPVNEAVRPIVGLLPTQLDPQQNALPVMCAPEGARNGKFGLHQTLTGGGRLVMKLDPPQDMSNATDLELWLKQTTGSNATNSYRARATLRDAAGRSAESEIIAIRESWQPLRIHLAETVSEKNVNLNLIQEVALEIVPRDTARPPEITIASDDWQLLNDRHTYTTGTPEQLRVEQRGAALVITRPDSWALELINRYGSGKPWLKLTHHGDPAPILTSGTATGLVWLDQAGFDGIAPALEQRFNAKPATANQAQLPTQSWPGPITLSQWRLRWANALAASVEVQQDIGVAEGSGASPMTLTWNMTLWVDGRVYFEVVPKAQSGEFPPPVTLAMILPESLVRTQTPPPEFAAYYPAGAWGGIYPHSFQAHLPVALGLRGIEQERDPLWRARPGQYYVTGIGIPTRLRTGPWQGMLVLDQRDPEILAAWQGQWLDATRPVFTRGKLESMHPLDADNDGMADDLGAWMVQLHQGRASFTLDPQQRQIVHPLFLVTGVPPGQGVFVNVDGHQTRSSVTLAEGGVLVQVPLRLKRAVHVEISTTEK